MADPITYVDRATGERLEETVFGESFVRWAYQDAEVRGLRRLLFHSALPSRLLGRYFDSWLSRRKIAPTIAQLGIDVNEFRDPVDSFGSFNAFFVRRLKPEARPFSRAPSDLLAPADGRTIAYPCTDGDTAVPVKGLPYRIRDLLQRDTPSFAGGTVLVVRLCPADYHRFHFPCDGRIGAQWEIPGAYHSVNPIALALGIDVFPRNKRACCLLESERFGTIAYVEVGAFGVGGIAQTYRGDRVTRMQEKGYFTFGGSTVVLVFEPGRVTLSPDLLANSQAGLETLVKVGQTIGTAAQ